MMPFEPATLLSDPRREMPLSPVARLDAAAAAVASLTAEHRRVSHLGLEWPIAHTERQLRYWRFVRAMCTIAAEAA